MAITLQANLSMPVAGLQTATYTVPVASYYTVSVQSTLPQGSGLQTVISLNGSPQVTVGGASNNPTPTQPSMGTSARLNCAAADVISVVLSSSNAVDSLPNAVKSMINLFQGE